LFGSRKPDSSDGAADELLETCSGLADSFTIQPEATIAVSTMAAQKLPPP
jgi:hypothetical protein